MGIVIHDGKDIYVGNRVAYNLAFRLEFVKQNILPFVFFCHFELENFCILHHHVVEIFAHFSGVSLENFTCLAHVLLVFLVALLVDARCSAVVDMVLQAGLVFAFRHPFLGNRKPASTRLVELLDDLQNGVHATDMRVGTEESSHLFINMTSFENTRKILVGHANRRVGFAVFQQHIVPWVVLFY